MNQTGQIQDVIALCVELTNEGKGHFFCNYVPHTQWLEVHARPADTDYSSQTVENAVYIDGFHHNDGIIRLKEPEANEQLEALIKKLEGML